ncbi:unnamed protein product [Paramecium pentaurelia]|uniref:Replication termination factor 2 n=1 Tax=Paramecium pentaurelia TaxID=43138 RepID=A0A8S1VP12_9CILI|nr:unnamed protein product [Paramecium pentaurelia]
MGNDGGSIAERAELVKLKKPEKRVESYLVAKQRAQFCSLTKERLRKPIACCRVGYLYNYDSLLKAFMDKKIPQELKHLQNMKKVKKLNITENPDKNNEFPFVCSISQKALNGKDKFLALWTCGCVFNKKLIKDLKIKELKCPICNKEYTDKDIVQLCPTNEDAEIKKAQVQKEIQLKDKQKEDQKQSFKVSDAIENLEQQQKKKICTEECKIMRKAMDNNKLQNLQNQGQDVKKNEIYQSLFHQQHKLEDNLFTRNVRFGNR